MNVESTLAFVDTNVLIYAYDRTAGNKHARAVALMADLWRSKRGCLSIQVLQEFYVVARRKLPDVRQEELDLILRDLTKWKIHRPSEQDVLNAIDLHRRLQVSFWDAMVINSALALGCPVLWSEDLNADQQMGSVRIQNPFVA